MNELINNKNIVICGPAPYLNQKKYGKKIDDFDVIIRFNKGHQLTKKPEIFGSRTDILYHCLSENREDGGPITENLIKNINNYIVASFPTLTKKENSSFPKGNISFINKFKKKYRKINITL